ncbi:MAG: chemotaxis protein CheA, partial [Oleibacter sp.]|nr:chemotaxis protein CheA [Thalassolituus sp.]
MSFDADEEILQDFLVEAGEILELLSEQLVDLEQSPDDKNLLNAIFRGFHTVKGGAGFLQLDALVECCHIAENVFDNLRNGFRRVDAELMDVVLQALDSVNDMFASVRAGQAPEHADPVLLQRLQEFASPAPAASTVDDEAATEETVSAADNLSVTNENVIENNADNVDAASDEITDQEFENLLDTLHGTTADKSSEPVSDTSATSVQSDHITDDEFEALLDQLHGNGKSATSAEKSESAKTAAQPNTVSSKNSEDKASNSDEITDSEFEELLDRLHGKGKHSSADVTPSELTTSKTTDKTAPVSAVVNGSSAPAAKAPEKPQAATAKVSAAPASVVKEAPKADKEIVAETTVRVDTKRLDDIMNMVGELVLVRNRLVRLGLKSTDESMAKAVANLDVVTGDLQTSVMKTRMQPIKKVFGRFPRVVRDLARQMKKEINLEMRGEETDLDKNLVEALADPLVHLVRNSVDHGVEEPAEREANGKQRIGTITLSAEQEGDHILLRIEDDGAGMDANVLRRKAVEKGVMDQDTADRLSDNDCFNLIFAPGFSTKDQISDISGRGVGMDVVKTKITQLNGTINIESHKGKGTIISIKVPLTLAIMPTLMVMLADQAFAFPLVSVNEIFHLDLSQTNIVDGQEVVVVRGKAIPLFHLKRWL